MEQKIYWDRVSEQKEFTTPFHADSFSKYVRPEGTVLDVGCGYGRTLDELHHNGYCTESSLGSEALFHLWGYEGISVPSLNVNRMLCKNHSILICHRQAGS